MCSAEAQARVADVRRDAFLRELSAVNADDGNFRRVFLLELPQLRKDMDAVDSAIGPEIEEQELTAKVGEGKFPTAGVDPLQGVGKIRRANRRRVHVIDVTWKAVPARKQVQGPSEEGHVH